MSEDKVREALARIVNTYDAYRRRGVSPAPAEYADVVAAIDAARAALATQAEKHAAELVKLRQWRDVADDMLTVFHEVASDDPRESIDRLINWHVQVALDPAVSSDAAALVEVGRQQGAKLRQGEALQPLSDHALWASDDLMAVNAEVGFRMLDIIKIARAIERLITERMGAAKETGS